MLFNFQLLPNKLIFKVIRWVFATIVVFWVFGWVYIQINHPTCTFRYKLTAEVMTPEGLKTGSSVVEVSYGSQVAPLAQGGRYDTLLGEATYVDLGHGKNLFVTLGSLDAAQSKERSNLPYRSSSLIESSDYEKMKWALDPLWLPIKIFKLGRTPGQERDMCQRVSKLFETPAETVPLNNLPTLVTFADLSQPLTGMAVNPNNLVGRFGAGYTMVAKIEFSKADITHRIDDLLPWVQDQTFGKVVGTSNRLGGFALFKFYQPTEETYLRN
jgi:hypothetical protein